MTVAQPSPPGNGGPPTSSSSGVTCDVGGADASYVEVVEGNSRTISASGCPNHASHCQKEHCDGTDSEATVQDHVFQIPSYPVIAETTTDVTSCTSGTIGIALNGVAIFSQTDGTDACGDAMQAESDSKFG